MSGGSIASTVRAPAWLQRRARSSSMPGAHADLAASPQAPSHVDVAEQLYSGQPLCRVPLGGDAHGEAAMHADVNGDGVLDHVAAIVGQGQNAGTTQKNVHATKGGPGSPWSA